MKFFRNLRIVIFLSILVSNSDETGRPCPEGLSLVLTDFEEFSNGSIYSHDRVFDRERVWWNNDVLYGCPCGNLTDQSICIRTCCNPGQSLNGSACVSSNENIGALRPLDENLAPDIRNMNKLEDSFYTITNKYCESDHRYSLDPDSYSDDQFVIGSNGVLTTKLQTFTQQDYCVGSSVNDDQRIVIIVCFPSVPINVKPQYVFYPIGMVSSIPFLLVTTIVYAVIEELRNLYGKSLMCYLGCLIYGYTGLAVTQLDRSGAMDLAPCVLLAFTIHFSFLASFFWLNVMCFDIWWTFGGFRSLQGSIKQRERKKFLMYSIYAWGCASLLTAICIIMDFVPGIPDHIVKPEFGVHSCWFKTEKAKAIYFYGPMGVTVLCNIVLFISTATKIIRHKKDTAHHLKGMDSKRHDDNKQWFNLYLKLFIVMGINWSMEIISWLANGPKYLWYLTDIANTLQGVIIFIIFVWKEKIKRLLMKRFGCKVPNFLSRDSTRSAYHSTASRTCTTSIPLHEKNTVHSDPNVSRIKTVSDDSDGV